MINTARAMLAGQDHAVTGTPDIATHDAKGA